MTDEAKRQEIAARDKTALLPDEAGPVPGGLYGYELAMTVAGAKVLSFKEFGSYQGRWVAHVELPNGERCFVIDWYGSCSGCDAFEGEFGWNDENEPGYAHKLRDFGRGYLTNCMTYEEALVEASRDAEWDSEASAMIAHIEATKLAA